MMGNYIVASVIFIVTFYFIISQKFDKTIISFAGALAMVGAGLSLGFYSQNGAFNAIDFNVLGLLIGMMVLVSVCKKTGFFSYIAIKAAKASGGSPLRLMVMMGLCTGFLSMVLDNVTTILLVIPITILICDILDISPLPIIVSEIVMSNVGGVGTMIGDPPNMIIASSAGFSFNDFIAHLFPIVLAAMALNLIVLAMAFKGEMAKRPKDFGPILNIDEKEAMRDGKSLIKVAISLIIVFGLFIAQKKLGLDHSFVALIGAGIALILVRPNVEEVVKDIEWPVLVFFASLFVLISGLSSTGLLNIIAGKAVVIAETNYNLAKLFILWASCIASSLVGSIPFTTAMAPVIKEMAKLGVETGSLWWALALGVGFGGNGTVIGSLAGMVGMAMSEKTREPIDFKMWLKTATLATLITTIFISLLIAFI